MRALLFRGIPKRESDFYFYKKTFPFPGNAYDGHFALGSLLIDENKGRAYICGSAIVAMNCTVGNAQCSAIEVEPDTVGQAIGITDNNGKQIFEGDIIRAVGNNNEALAYTGTVVYRGSTFFMEEKNALYSELHSFKKTVMYDDMQASTKIKYTFEVIGNVHDNPELAKGDTNG